MGFRGWNSGGKVEKRWKSGTIKLNITDWSIHETKIMR